MATNEYLPFGTATGANAISTSAYNSLAARLTGFAAGVALSQQVNKPLRQTSSIAAMIGAFIAAAGYDALDDGDQTTLLANYELALKKIIEDNLPDTVDLSGYLLKSGGTMTGLLKAPAGLQTTATTLSAATTLTTADSGKFIEITAASTIVTSLPTPVGNGGVNYMIWANSVSAQTIRTAVAGAFQGPGSSGATTMSIPAGAVVSVFSDGYNWIIGSYKEVPVVKPDPKFSVIDTSTTWTKQTGSTFAFIVVQGAGGAGGGTNASGSIASGGGAGGCSASLINLSSITSVACSIAAGGTPVNGENGNPGGGVTSFGALVTANPGQGGFRAASYDNSASQAAFGGAIAGAVGQFRQAGNTGNRGAINGGGTGTGGAGLLGGAGQGGFVGDDGYDGHYGGGGGGASGGATYMTKKGGTGGDGLILVYEW